MVLKTTSTRFQVGVDTQPTNDPVRFGVAFAYTMSDTDYARGTADMDAYSLAGYGLWLGDNGQFVDVVAVIGRPEDRYDGRRHQEGRNG